MAKKLPQGTKLLRAFFKDGPQQSQVATELGMCRQEFTHFLSGRRVPNLKKALLLEKRTGIPVSAWMS